MRISDWSSYVCSSDLFLPSLKPFQPGPVECLGFDIFLDSLGAALAPEPRLLDAAERRRRHRDRARIEADHAEFQRLAHAPGAVDIAGEVIGRKPEGRGIGRSEERRGGKECVSTCRSGWSPYH